MATLNILPKVKDGALHFSIKTSQAKDAIMEVLSDHLPSKYLFGEGQS